MLKKIFVYKFESEVKNFGLNSSPKDDQSVLLENKSRAHPFLITDCSKNF